MDAITYTHYGTPDQLKLTAIATPEPGEKEVLLHVKAASVNPYDWHFLSGEPLFMRLFIGLRRPRSNRLGRDVAGIVSAVGPGISEFKVGDEVYGAADGAFSEQAIAKVAELGPKPASLTWTEAAAIPMAAFTGLQGLRAGASGLGKRVLINGASGGIGHFAVQLAKADGAHVTAVCSSRNKQWVANLGADQVICYDQEPIDGTYDLFLDMVGNYSLRDTCSYVAPGGSYVWLGSAKMGKVMGPIGRMIASSLYRPGRGISIMRVDAKRTRADLDELSQLVDAGKLRPVVEQVFTLADTGAALAHVGTGHTQGKTCIDVNA